MLARPEVPPEPKATQGPKSPDVPRISRGRSLALATAAAGCALAATAAALVPAGTAEHRVTTVADRADRAAAAPATCTDPEASLRPGDGADGPAVRRIKSRGRLIAGVDQDSFRWGYRNPSTGELSGFDIDLTRAIAKDILGDADKVTFLAIPTSQRIPALEKGKVDLIARTMSITCDRIRQVAFSTAYFVAGQQILAPRGSSVTAFDDSLKGKKVCAAKGATAESKMREQPHGARLVTVPNQLDCLVRLQLGQVDAVLTDNALGAGLAAQDPSVELVGKPFTTDPYGVAMNLRDEDLVRRVNKVLDDYRSGGGDSPWMRAYTKWLAADLKGYTAPPAPKYRD
ncbi:sugar-binding protein [Streptomyces albireticuli]|uniref:Sugar-binding protein n=1 Tax=Streptomyces albireticuli TaxID=1940 RepID=A0A1Z2L708_9ACTN|nr:sugar-binding protein [Streptomyces albireticuli]